VPDRSPGEIEAGLAPTTAGLNGAPAVRFTSAHDRFHALNPAHRAIATATDLCAPARTPTARHSEQAVRQRRFPILRKTWAHHLAQVAPSAERPCSGNRLGRAIASQFKACAVTPLYSGRISPWTRAGYVLHERPGLDSCGISVRRRISERRSSRHLRGSSQTTERLHALSSGEFGRLPRGFAGCVNLV
jgi:hypothetical protein